MSAAIAASIDSCMKLNSLTLIVFALCLLNSLAHAKPNKGGPDPMKPDANYAIQGEYSGVTNSDKKLGVQVIAMGDQQFRAVGHMGGLPGFQPSTELPSKSTTASSGGF